MSTQITIGDASFDEESSLTLTFGYGEFTVAEFRRRAIEEIDRGIAGILAMEPGTFLAEEATNVDDYPGYYVVHLNEYNVYRSSRSSYSYLCIPNLDRRLDGMNGLEINYEMFSRKFKAVIPRHYITSDSITVSMHYDEDGDMVPNPSTKWGRYFVEIGE